MSSTINTEYQSTINIIETNLVPSTKMIKNIVPCTIIVDSSNTETANIFSMNEEAKLNGEPMFTHNYFISKEGQIFRGRSEEYCPAIDDKFSLNCIGIMLEGQFNDNTVGTIQFNNLIALIFDICARNKYIGSSIYTHSELNSEEYGYTPGKLFPYVEFRNRIYRNFLNISDKITDINGTLYYAYGSRALEYKIPNMTGSDVYQLKVLLTKIGYELNSIDGIYDTNLKEVLYRYFKDFNIRRESYYSSIITEEELLELNDKVINSSYDRSENYRRYLRVTNPVMFGDDIKLLKGKLWTLGFYTGKLNNLYDEEMAESVKLFQKKYGLIENGEVGSLLFYEIMRSIDYTFKRVLEITEPLMEGADVEIIQKALFRKGYSVDINGYYDIKSYTAVCNYQIDNNITVDGKVDQYLFDSILTGYN